MKIQKQIPFETLCKGITGDAEAMESIISNFRPAIRQMATKRLFDLNGNAYKGVDEALCRRLEAKLMLSILKFRIRKE